MIKIIAPVDGPEADWSLVNDMLPDRSYNLEGDNPLHGVLTGIEMTDAKVVTLATIYNIVGSRDVLFPKDTEELLLLPNGHIILTDNCSEGWHLATADPVENVDEFVEKFRALIECK